MGRILVNLDDIRPKSVKEMKIRAFDRLETNFGQKNYFVHRIENKFSKIEPRIPAKGTDNSSQSSSKSPFLVFESKNYLHE
jgi:hypothetical protein